MYLSNMSKAVFNGCHTTDNSQGRQGHFSDRKDIFGHIPKSKDVRHLSALLFGQANSRHFNKTAFHRATESRVTFHAIQ
ncbi:hypothetical protein SDC9_132405 [bioreactor metagenome]|uniref:Uncharacterized protein n=1 Tax=bioreactor metagenome TaxID=1076179 RepID=A0A645D805_9ZZZZ